MEGEEKYFQTISDISDTGLTSQTKNPYNSIAEYKQPNLKMYKKSE